MNINDNLANELADLFKVFGDASRIKILTNLYNREICVQQMVDELGMTQSAVSHQLKILKMSKLIKSRREGKQMYYSLSDDHVSTMVAMGLEHLTEED